MIDEVARRPAADVTFRITVGDAETDEPVDHGEGLIQRESQRSTNRRMRDALMAKGYRVSYHEFAGGHDIDAWRDDLSESLVSLFHC